MTKQHTPGPWQVHKSRTTDDVGIIGDDGCLAECFSEIRKSGEKAFAEQMANARLIAAAPDMLEALIAAEESIATFIGVHQYPIDSGAGDILRQVSAAIAKAEGRT